MGVVREPVLTLQRDRYVLPPEPEPPSPRSLEERRRLEAEWPPVSAIPDAPPPPAGPLRVRWSGACGPVVHHHAHRQAGAVQSGYAPPTVRVRVVRTRHRAAPEIILVR